MSAEMTAGAVLDRVYLEIRARLLEIGASLDRIDRSEGRDDLAADSRLTQLQEGLAILAAAGGDRAERIQMLFSDPYVANWNRRGGASVDPRK